MKKTRLCTALMVASGGVMLSAGLPAFAQSKPMKIGVIGSGRIGSTIGGLWVKAGHEVMFSDRDPEQVKRAIDGLGPESRPKARAGSVHEAASFGDAVLIAVPYAALPAIRDEVGSRLRGKVIIDPNNPVPSRDGETIRIDGRLVVPPGERCSPPLRSLQEQHSWVWEPSR